MLHVPLYVFRCPRVIHDQVVPLMILAPNYRAARIAADEAVFAREFPDAYRQYLRRMAWEEADRWATCARPAIKPRPRRGSRRYVKGYPAAA